MSLRRLPALPSASAVPSVHVESAVTVASAVPSVHVESLVDIESETLVDTGEAPAALATPARGDVTGESSNEACAGVNRDEREATGSAESKDGAGSGGARVTPASEQATTTAAAAAVVAVHGGVVAPRISTVSPRATHAQALIFGDSPVSASAYCGGTAIVWLGGTLVVALWLCIPVYDARASSLSGSALVNASSAAGVGPAGMDFTWFASAFHPLYFLSAIAVGFGLWGQALPLPSAPAIAGVCIVTCGMDAGLLFMLKAYYFESRVLTFGSTTLVIALAFFAFMAWYVTRHHERVTQFRLESLRKWSPRARRSRVLPARAPPSATALGGDEKIALIGGPDGLLPRELTDGAVAAAPRSHGAHSVDDQASAPAAIQSLSLENFVSKEAPRVPRLSIAAVQRHNLPVPSSVLQKQVEANLRVTGGVIVISALILVSYSYCQGFTWAYVKYASGNDSLQVLMSTIFQWPLFIVGNLLTRVAESVDERVRGSRALEPAMTFLNALFTEIFAKNLFTSVTTYETFAAFEVLAIAQLILQFPLRMSRFYVRLRNRVVRRAGKFLGLKAVLAMLGEGELEGLTMYRKKLALEFFFTSLAQRVSMLAFAAFVSLIRAGPNSAAYPFGAMHMSDSQYSLLLSFAWVMAIVEWSASTLIHFIIYFAYRIDSTQIGGRALVSCKLVPLCTLCTWHVLSDIYLALNSLEFA